MVGFGGNLRSTFPSRTRNINENSRNTAEKTQKDAEKAKKAAERARKAKAKAKAESKKQRAKLARSVSREPGATTVRTAPPPAPQTPPPATTTRPPRTTQAPPPPAPRTAPPPAGNPKSNPKKNPAETTKKKKPKEKPKENPNKKDFIELSKTCQSLHSTLRFKLKGNLKTKLAALDEQLQKLTKITNPNRKDLEQLRYLHASYVKLNTLPVKQLIKALDGISGAKTPENIYHATNGFFEKHPPIPRKYRTLCLVATGIVKKFPEARLALKKFFDWLKQMKMYDSLKTVMNPGLVTFFEKLSGASSKVEKVKNFLEKTAEKIGIKNKKQIDTFITLNRGDVLYKMVNLYKKESKLSKSDVSSIIKSEENKNHKKILEQYDNNNDHKTLLSIIKIIAPKIDKKIKLTSTNHLIKLLNK